MIRTPRRAGGKDSGPIWAGGDADSGRGRQKVLLEILARICGRFSSPKTWRTSAESVPGAEKATVAAVSEARVAVDHRVAKISILVYT